jgi:hypothetical protein
MTTPVMWGELWLGRLVERIGSPPDTHCWDDDNAADSWSYSPQMVADLLAAERERCAKLCDEVSETRDMRYINSAVQCAARIRGA